MSDNKGEMVIYTTADVSIQTVVRLEAETLWLTQRKMSELFDKDSDTIGLHLKNIYAEGELEETATTEDFSVVQTSTPTGTFPAPGTFLLFSHPSCFLKQLH